MPELDGIVARDGDPRLGRRSRDARSSSCRRSASTIAAAMRSPPSSIKPVKPSALHDTLATVLAGQAASVPVRAAGTGIDHELGARHPLRILLAEDNPVNQKLALRLLERMGYARGRRRRRPRRRSRRSSASVYDVVLMDVQMPELDGLEATRRIRARWPGAAGPRIVAMTANAMEGDREMCLAAGMDDYISKPIRPEALSQALGAIDRASGVATDGPRERRDRRARPRRRRHLFNRRLLVRLLTSIGHETLEADRRSERPRPAARPATPRRSTSSCSTSSCPRWTATRRSRRSRPTEPLRDLPVIVISGVDELESVVRCIQMGAADYLPKTVAPEILRARIEASMAQKRLHDLERETLEQQRRLVATIDRQRSELSRFLSPQVAALVSSDDGEAMLAGHRREITAMFCDLRNFTGLLRDGRTRGGPRLPARVPRRDGPAHRGPRGDARALRRRRVHDLLQRPGPPARPRRPGGRAWPSRCATGSRRCRRTGASAATSSRSAIGIATGYATLGRIGFEGRYDYGAVGQGHHPGRPAERRGGARARSSSAAGPSPPPRTGSRRRPPAIAQLKGFSRPDPGLRRDRHAPGRRHRHEPPTRLDSAAFAPPARYHRRRPRVRRRADRHLPRRRDGPARGDARGRGGGRRGGDGPAGPQPQVEQRERRRHRRSPSVPLARGRRSIRARSRMAAARVAACEAAFAEVRTVLLAERAAR